MTYFLDTNFILPNEFISDYEEHVPMGFNGVGLITFYRSYSLQKDDGTMESWRDCCQRVIEQMYAIQKWHCNKYNRFWNEQKALISAKEAFDRMYNFKWLPPGRGLATMGTSLVSEVKGVESLQNCAFVSTDTEDLANVFEWAMIQLMLGVGVGFDTKGENLNLEIKKPYVNSECTYVIEDTREAWAKSIADLLNCFLTTDPQYILCEFDYSKIRPKGAMINTFKRPASGPEPLKLLHKRLIKLCNSYIGKFVDSAFITDVFNMIAACVVSGSVRRSAQIALGDVNDIQFLDLKNYDLNSYRLDWGWNSNNSVILDKYQNSYEYIVDRIYNNGEPGLVWRNNFKYARMNDEKYDNAMGVNP